MIRVVGTEKQREVFYTTWSLSRVSRCAKPCTVRPCLQVSECHPRIAGNCIRSLELGNCSVKEYSYGVLVPYTPVSRIWNAVGVRIPEPQILRCFGVQAWMEDSTIWILGCRRTSSTGDAVPNVTLMAGIDAIKARRRQGVPDLPPSVLTLFASFTSIACCPHVGYFLKGG